MRQAVGQLTKWNPRMKLTVTKAESAEGDTITIDTADDVFYHAHVCPPARLEHQKMIYIVRNPRNSAISYIRWLAKRDDHTDEEEYTVSRGLLERLITGGAFEYGPWPMSSMNFSVWCDIPGVHVVRFEEIYSDGGDTIRGIADFVGRDYDQRVYNELYGNGKIIAGREVYRDKSTWTGEKPSDWREYRHLWDKNIEVDWEDCGGLAVEKRLGYYGN